MGGRSGRGRRGRGVGAPLRGDCSPRRALLQRRRARGLRRRVRPLARALGGDRTRAPALVREDSPTRRVGAPRPLARPREHLLRRPPARSPRRPDAIPPERLQRRGGPRVRRARAPRARRRIRPHPADDSADDSADAPGRPARATPRRLARVQLCAEPKIDGASASVRYEDGVLVRCVSRGDGETGEDVTRQLAGAIGVPRRLSGDEGSLPRIWKFAGGVPDARFRRRQRGEGRRGLRRFKNARNAAAGALRRLEPRPGTARTPPRCDSRCIRGARWTRRRRRVVVPVCVLRAPLWASTHAGVGAETPPRR